MLHVAAIPVVIVLHVAAIPVVMCCMLLLFQ